MIEKPDDLLNIKEKALIKYFNSRLSGDEITPPLDSKIEESLEDVFIQAFHIKEKNSDIRQKKKKYTDILIRLVSLKLENELKNKWGKHFTDNHKKIIDTKTPFNKYEETSFFKIEKKEADSFRRVTQLVHIAEELCDEDIGRIIFDAFGNYLFPPEKVKPLEIEIDLLGLITIVPSCGHWWKKWIDKMELKKGADEPLSPLSKACRARFPTVIFGLITAKPLDAIKFFIQALECIKKGEVETDAEIFIQDIVQGLVSHSLNDYPDYLSEFFKICECNLKFYDTIYTALNRIKFNNKELNDSIDNLKSKLFDAKIKNIIEELIAIINTSPNKKHRQILMFFIDQIKPMLFNTRRASASGIQEAENFCECSIPLNKNAVESKLLMQKVKLLFKKLSTIGLDYNKRFWERYKRIIFKWRIVKSLPS